jgi:hypothetical protein
MFVSVSACVCLISVPATSPWLFCCATAFLVPYALCSMQRFKNTINGPWDEARVRELHSED